MMKALLWAAMLALVAEGAVAEMRPQPRPVSMGDGGPVLEVSDPAARARSDGADGGRETQGRARPERGQRDQPAPAALCLAQGNEGNARRGPRLTHRIDWVFTRAGMPLRITAEFEHWRRVEDSEGVGGWVNFVCSRVCAPPLSRRTWPSSARFPTWPRPCRSRPKWASSGGSWNAIPTGAACRSTGRGAGCRRRRSGASIPRDRRIEPARRSHFAARGGGRLGRGRSQPEPAHADSRRDPPEPVGRTGLGHRGGGSLCCSSSGPWVRRARCRSRPRWRTRRWTSWCRWAPWRRSSMPHARRTRTTRSATPRPRTSRPSGSRSSCSSAPP